MPFDEIATIVGTSPTATRQLASRARRKVQTAPTALEPDVARQRHAVSFSRPAAALWPILVNGAAGVVVVDRSGVVAVMAFSVTGGRIGAISVLNDPARLRQLDLATLEGGR